MACRIGHLDYRKVDGRIIKKRATVMVMRIVKTVNGDVFGVMNDVAVGHDLAIRDEESGSEAERLLIRIKNIDDDDRWLGGSYDFLRCHCRALLGTEKHPDHLCGDKDEDWFMHDGFSAGLVAIGVAIKFSMQSIYLVYNTRRQPLRLEQKLQKKI
jgi:hypothetical protein